MSVWTKYFILPKNWSIHDFLINSWSTEYIVTVIGEVIILSVWLLEARSPVFSHLSSTLHGLSTIRAFKVQQSFQQMFDEYQDVHSGKNAEIPGINTLCFEVNVFIICVDWQRPGFYSWPLLAGWLYALMGFAPFLSRPQPLPAFTSGTVQYGLLYFHTWHSWHVINENMIVVKRHVYGLWYCRARSGFRGSGSVLRHDSYWHVSVGCQTECRDREHGETIHTLQFILFSVKWIRCWNNFCDRRASVKHFVNSLEMWYQ